MHCSYLNAIQLYSLVVPYRKMLITFFSGHENKYINGGFPDSATANTWSLGWTWREKNLKLSEARNVDKFEIISDPMVAIKYCLKLTAMHDMPDPPTLLFIDSSFVSKSKKWSKFPVTKSNVHSSNTARFRLLAQSYPNESL